MFLETRYAGWGRGFWIDVNDGTIEVRTRERRLHVRVQNGLVVQQTDRKKDECTTLKYGDQRKTRKNNKVEEEYFQPGTLRAIRRGSLWKRQTGLQLCGSKGTLECYSTSGGAYGKEVFTYDNGIQAYEATRWKRKLELNRPNGKPWMVIEGTTRLDRWPIAERLAPDEEDLGISNLVRGRDWNVTIYDVDGINVVTEGQVKDRQKQGKWLEQGKETYYLSGVKVSRRLYEEDPDKWDAHEVLRIPNAQLRCSLLNRMGYDKLLARVNSRVISSSDDGGQLLEIGTGSAKDSVGLDGVMRLVKVVCPSTRQTYVLRVPPEIDNFEQARQWTFGLRESSISEGARLELVNET